MGFARRAETRRRGRLLVLAVLAVATSVVVPASSGATVSGINLRIDFETGDASQLSALECPHPATQFEVYAAGTSTYPAPRQGAYAARFSETPSDIWPGNNMVRCLGARYDTGETTGGDDYYGFSVYLPATGLGSNLIWELHHPSSLYALSGCGVAPFALISSAGGLQFRISTGNCTVGSGYAYWSPHIVLPGLQSAPRSVWIDFLIHIVFAETNSGTVEVSYRVGGDAWPSTPQLARYGIPTMPFASSVNVHNVTLYTELGLYTGYSPYNGYDTVFLDGYRRGSRDAVMAEFPGAGSQTPSVSKPASIAPPAVSGSAVDGAVLTSSAGVWANGPTAFSYVWQSSRDGGASWQAVVGASSSSLVLGDGLVGAAVRVVVTAANVAGGVSAASAPTAVVAPPAIVQNVVAGQRLSGTVTWTATPSTPVRQVVFAIDSNRITYTDASAPFEYPLDTTKLADGTHTVGLTVTLLDGTVVWQPYQVGAVTVSN